MEKRALRVLAVPQRGLHGHINPMLSFCKSLVSTCTKRDIYVSLVVTKSWLESTHHDGCVDSDGDKIRFVESDETKTEEEALERLLDAPERLLDAPERLRPDFIVADTFLAWAVRVGETRNIPVASFWPASASLFTAAYHYQLLLQAYSFPLHGDMAEERTNIIPGIPSIRLLDLPGEIQSNYKQALDTITKAVTTATKAQCIIFRTTMELEESALTALRNILSIPMFPIGPTIPFSITNNTSTATDYMKWLDMQQQKSVLYVSLGTNLSAANDQIDELAIALKQSRIPFLWVAPNRAHHLAAIFGDHTPGKVVNWCDQMKVLRHYSIGGFLTHCGWNSTLEAAFAGVPILTFPLGLDQTLNNKLIVEDWGIGWRAKTNFQELVNKNHLSELLSKFMDSKSDDRKELDGRCHEFQQLLLLGIDEVGSTSSLDDFILNVIQQIE